MVDSHNRMFMRKVYARRQFCENTSHFPVAIPYTFFSKDIVYAEVKLEER